MKTIENPTSKNAICHHRSLSRRTHVTQIQANQREEKENRARELTRAVQEATMKQLRAQIEADIQLLREKLENTTDQAAETAKDLKYVRERQMHLDDI